MGSSSKNGSVPQAPVFGKLNPGSFGKSATQHSSEGSEKGSSYRFPKPTPTLRMFFRGKPITFQEESQGYVEIQCSKDSLRMGIMSLNVMF